MALCVVLLFSLPLPTTVSSDSELRTAQVLRVNNPAANDTDAIYDSIALSGSGAVHAAWRELNYTTETWSVMYSNLQTGNQGFGQKQTLSSCPDPADPTIPIAAHGTVIHLAYTVARGPGCPDSQIVVRTSLDDGISFGPEVPIPTTGSDYNWNVDLATGPDGELYLVWNRAVVGVASWLEVSWSTDGGQTFEAPVVVNPIHNFTGDFDAIVDPLGRLHVVWLDVVPPGQTWMDLYYSWADPSLTFSPMTKIDGNVTGWHYMERPQLAVSRDATKIVVAWADSRATPGVLAPTDLFVVRSTDRGQSWSPEVMAIQGPSGSSQGTPAVALDEFDRTYLVWGDNRDYLVGGARGRDIYLSRSDDGFAYNEWPLDVVNRSYQDHPSMLYRSGFLHLVFPDRSDGRMWGIVPLTDIRFVRLDPPPSAPVVSYSDLRPRSFRAMWSRPPDLDLSRFDVQLAGPGDATFTTVFTTSDVAVNSTPITGLLENAQYRFRVLAFDGAGGWSASSVVDVATPNAEPARPVLSVASLTPSSAFLEWTPDDSPDFSEYVLEVARSADFASPIAVRRFVDRNDTDLLLGGLSERTKHYGRVTARDSHGAANVSDVVPWTTPNGAPEPVRILEYYAMGSDSLFLSWEYSYAEDFFSYEVYAFDSLSGTGDPAAVVTDRATTSHLVTGLSPGTVYWLEVVVVDSGGLDAPSGRVSGLTLPPPEDHHNDTGVPLWQIASGLAFVVGGIVLALVWRRRRRS